MPDRDAERLRHLALTWGAGLGPAAFQRVVRHCGSTREALEAGVDELRAPALRLSPDQVARVSMLRDRMDEFADELEALRREYIAVLCPWDEAYPAPLRDLPSAPPVLYVAGHLLPRDGHAIAVVGTRTPAEEARRMAHELGRAFAETDTTVVSGLALGCDTAAHQGALEGGGRTVAVLGSGIRAVYPRENLDLAREVSQHGAVISEQPPGAHPTLKSLMARNRLQSALSLGVLVVASRATGGALQTAANALKQGRAVYAVRWPEGREEAAGTAKLLRQGAGAVDGPGDAARVRLELLDHTARMERMQQKRAEDQLSLFE